VGPAQPPTITPVVTTCYISSQVLSMRTTAW